MKVVILAGGFGTRISEESHLKPKPMITIGDHPILWHIMKIYSHYGFNDFIICLGYKGILIKEYFDNYFLYESDVTFHYSSMKKSTEFHSTFAEPWTVTLVNTGLTTMTGGRIKRIQKYVGNEPFLLTYGDGVSDIPIDKLIEHHKSSKKLLTVTAIQPSGRFGMLNIDASDTVASFVEKPKGDSDWINGGFFVCQPEAFEYIYHDDVNFENNILPELARQGHLSAYKHKGFWGCMDTIRDMENLNRLWKDNQAPWKKWSDA